jgi:AraC family transcriptional regulator of adaptative response/methylated-DNA-[protein]-cysteine methyltransferase
MNEFLDDDARWTAVATRDPHAVGRFWYGVSTTGVYCRPDCAARPNRAHVAFYASPAAARAAGLRPCRRCTPDRERLRYATARVPFGTVLLACAGADAVAVELADDASAALVALRARFPNACTVADPRGLADALDTVRAAILAGASTSLALAPRGSAFQQRVWRGLRDIPRGTTVDYATLAQRIGRPAAVRAVANACGANPLAALIPCHRVRRRDGRLGGFRWGLARKRALLALEGVGSRAVTTCTPSSHHGSPGATR